MFGKLAGGVPGELDLSKLRKMLVGSQEFLRVWHGAEGVGCFLNTRVLGDDSFLLGIALADCARHGAKAYAQATGVSESEALARIFAGFDAERMNPTDEPVSLMRPEGELN